MPSEQALPQTWEVAPLSNLTVGDTVTYGVVQPGPHAPGGTPMLRVNNFRGFGFDTSDVLRIAPEIEAKYGRTRLCADDVLITIVGSVGQVAIVPKALEGWNIARAVALVRPKTSSMARWIALFLRSPGAQHALGVAANTTVQTTINLKDLKLLSVPIPPEEELEGITATLSALDDKIALLRETNATLEAIAQALFKSWFVDFDPVRAKAEGRDPIGMPPEVADLFPSKFEDSALGEIPKGWQAMRLDQVCEINPTRRLSKGTEAPYLEMAAVPTSGHRPEAPVGRPFSSGTKFINGDTLLARITPCLENGKTAFVDFLEGGAVGWGSTEYIVMRPKPPLSDYWAYLLCRHAPFRQFAIQAMVGTSGRQRVEVSRLAQYPVAVPDEQVAGAFAAIVEPLRARIAANDEEAKTLSDLRDTLLPRLMSGKLRIPETQEAAEEATA